MKLDAFIHLDISFPSLPFLCMLLPPSSILSRLHDPILEETLGAQNLSKEPYGGNLQGLKSPDEGSSKGPHGQLLSLLSSFTILQQKLRCPNHPDKSQIYMQWGKPQED